MPFFGKSRLKQRIHWNIFRSSTPLERFWRLVLFDVYARSFISEKATVHFSGTLGLLEHRASSFFLAFSCPPTSMQEVSCMAVTCFCTRVLDVFVFRFFLRFFSGFSPDSGMCNGVWCKPTVKDRRGSAGCRGGAPRAKIFFKFVSLNILFYGILYLT